VEKESLKPGVKASGVMDGESGESIEENVPVVGAGVRIRETGAWLPKRNRELIRETRRSILKRTMSYA